MIPMSIKILELLSNRIHRRCNDETQTHEKVISILETYEPPLLSENICTNIRSIIEEAEKELGVYQKREP